ncbi:GNAT family N-acetyltransferase [Rhodovulum sp. DZ06]|uniref:GNAT family N-acetyltransferase n=1 Tax=Rhodovulum sp. DZ06 TaxID=3425126 RepID=UPI003D341181
MAEGAEVRAAGAQDAATLSALHQAAFAGMERGWSAEEFASLIAAPGGFALLAAPVPGAAATAFLLGRAAGGEAELLSIGAAPAARRMGLGAALLARFDAEARARGAEAAFLEVAVDNPGAEALYRRAGWAEVGRRRAYAERPGGARVDALVLRRDYG